MVTQWAAYDGRGRHRVVAVVDGEAVGQASVWAVDGMGQTGHEAEFEGREGQLAYLVRPDYAGRGLASVLTRDALTNAFGRLGLRRVQAGCFANNTASWKVMEKLGMRREGHLRENAWIKGEWVDSLIFAMLDREWG